MTKVFPRQHAVSSFSSSSPLLILSFQGYQTGYIYKQPITYDIKVSRAGSEVEIPPSATNIPNYGPEAELSPSKVTPRTFWAAFQVS